MPKTKDPARATSPESQPNESSGGIDKSHSKIFVSMAMDMSWRLAIVVLLPIVGGVKLDEIMGTTPFLALMGIVIATIGVAYVMWRTYKLAENVELPQIDNQEKN